MRAHATFSKHIDPPIHPPIQRNLGSPRNQADVAGIYGVEAAYELCDFFCYSPRTFSRASA